MRCVSCFGGSKQRNPVTLISVDNHFVGLLPDKRKPRHWASKVDVRIFTFRELAAATKNFSAECLLGEGGFGRVYKGRLNRKGENVAIKHLDRNGLQGNREFLVEVLMLSLLHHPNLVNLIGYCSDRNERLLVYEYLPLGCLEYHLYDRPSGRNPLDWNTRMKIAAGASKALEYLHTNTSHPVIYRDFKSANILLDENYNPKLSDFGLAKLGPVGDKTHVTTRVMGTYGYCAPEYAMTGNLTLKSDIYSFGVVLLELITGRKSIDNTKPVGEHNLVVWARPLLKDFNKYPLIADPLLKGHYPMRGLYRALSLAAACLQEQPCNRPDIGPVANTLDYLSMQKFHPVNYQENSTEESPDSDPVTGVIKMSRKRDYSGEEGGTNMKRNCGNPLKDVVDRLNQRERAVAEAKGWGERARKRGNVALESCHLFL